jgi:hypothetical protein
MKTTLTDRAVKAAKADTADALTMHRWKRLTNI